jgi:uroporphyrinogen-III synthase
VRLPALAGTTVAITADRRRDEQAELFERRGARVLHGPTIRTIPLVHDERLHDAIEAVVGDPPTLVVLTTALGLRSWLAAAESLDRGEELTEALRSSELLVRGAKAVGAAVTAGLDVAWSAPGATASEIVERLAERAAERGPGEKVAVQLDGDPDTALPGRIRALGYDVLEVPVYQWTMPADPTPARRLIGAVADGSVDAVTFTSGPALRNFFALASDAGLAEHVREAFAGGDVAAVCVGPVSAAQARALGVASPVSPVHHRLGAMVQACVTHRGEERRDLVLAGVEVVVQGRVVVVVADGAGADATGPSDTSGPSASPDAAFEPVELTDRERGVLEVLLRRPGAVVAKSVLGREVWGGAADDHTTEVTVARLRRRLGPAGAAIETVVRRGYRVQVD